MTASHAVPTSDALGQCGMWTTEHPASPPNSGIGSVTVIAPDDIWAVGTIISNPPGGTTEWFSHAMHYDGDGWTSVPVPSPLNTVGESIIRLFDVAAVSSNEVYAAGWYEAQNNTSDTLVLRWDGSTWEHILSPGQSHFGAQGFLFDAVAVADAQNIWFSGLAASGPTCNRCPYMVHYDGSNFTEYFPERDPTSTTGYHRIRDISVISVNDIWAAGGTGGSPQGIGGNYVTHWDGSSWSHIPTPQPGFGEVLRAVVAVAPDDVWVAGSYTISVDSQIVTLPLFLRWDGSSWTQFEAPAFVYDLVAFASDDIYGVGSNAILHWDGSAWSVDTSDLGVGPFLLQDVDAIGPCDLIAVGGDTAPLVARLRPGSTCPADFAEPFGQLDFSDVVAFLTAFGAMDPSADLALPLGSFDFSDIVAFLAAFGAGCP